jgi:hypothetical protein
VPMMDSGELPRLALHIDDMLAHVRSFNDNPGFAVRAGSRCTSESESMRREAGPNGPWNGRDAGLAAQMGWLLLEASGRYLAACAVLLRSDWPMFALPPVVRSAIETMGRAGWLLDPNVADVRVRAARVRLLWRDELAHARGLSKALRAGADEAAFWRARTDWDAAIRADFVPAEVRFDNPEPAAVGFVPTLCGQRLPGLEASVKQLEVVPGDKWGAGAFYAFLAASSHPNLLPIMNNLVTTAPDPAVTAAGLTSIHPNLIDVGYLAKVASNAVSIYLDIWLLVADYHGVTPAEVDPIRDFYLAAER